MVADAAARVSRLLARAVAAKEVASKNMTPLVTLPPVAEEAPAEVNALGIIPMGQVRALGKLRAQHLAHQSKLEEERLRQKQQFQDDGDDGDGGDVD